MGLETVSFSDSDDNGADRSDVVYQSTAPSARAAITFQEFISEAGTVSRVDGKSPKFPRLERKWLKCVLFKAPLAGLADSEAHKQLRYCSSAVKATLMSLNPYQSVLFFSYLFYKHGADTGFTKSLHRLLVRWHFCLKYDFLIAEYPYLSSVLTFNSVIWGLKSVFAAYSSFLDFAYTVHEGWEGLLEPMLPWAVSGGAIARRFSLLSDFQTTSEVANLCGDFLQYVLDVTLSLSNDGLVFKHELRDSALEGLWTRISQYDFKSGCKCRKLLYLMYLDSYADVLSGCSSSIFHEPVSRLVGLYAKWLLSMTASKNVRGSVMSACPRFMDDDRAESALDGIQKLVDGMDFPCFTVKSEHKDTYCYQSPQMHPFSLEDWIPCLFSRFLKNCSDVYGAYESVPDPVLALSYGFMAHEASGPHKVRKDLAAIGGSWVPEPFTLGLLGHGIGRELALKFNPRMRFCTIQDRLDEADISPTGSDMDTVFGHCWEVYKAILSAGGLDLGTGSTKIYATTTLSSDVESSYVFGDFTADKAQDFLDQLWDVLRGSGHSVSSLSMGTECAGMRGRLAGEELKFMEGTSLLPSAIIAIATVMYDDVYLDFSCEHTVRVLVAFKSVYRASRRLLSLFLKLLYAELADDFVLALEYRDAELALYRTMLMRYVLQLAVSPIDSTCKVRFYFNGRVESEEFIARLFKFINFRTNYVLMDAVVFEKYLTTRVVTEFSDDASSPGSQHGVRSSRSSTNALGEGARTDASDWKTEDDYGSEDVDLPTIMSVFGFLEYHKRRLKQRATRVQVKSEDQSQEEAYFDREYFFDLSFKFLGALRFFVTSGREFAADILDQFTFRYYLRLCSNDFYDAVNTGVIYSSIKHVLTTSQLGQRVDNAIFAHYFGACGVSNKFMESLGLMDNNRAKKARSGTGIGWRVQLVDLLRLNNRYTKRFYYRMTRMLCAGFFRFVPLECLTSLLCSWASCLPTDSTSTVRSEKTGISRFVVFLLLSRMCAVSAQLSLRAVAALERLVSAVNVVFVNLDIIYKGTSGQQLCEVISDDEPASHDSGQELQHFMSGQLDVSASNFYDRLVTEYNALREHSAQRLRERREAVRRRNLEQVHLLLEASSAFSDLLDGITQTFYKALTDPANSYITNSGEGAFVSCVGKRRNLFYATVDFLALADNTMSNLIRTCVLSTLVLSREAGPLEGACGYGVCGAVGTKLEASGWSEFVHGPASTGSMASNPPSRFATPCRVKVEEPTGGYSQVIAGIKSHKERIRARHCHLSSMQSAEVLSSEAETPVRVSSQGQDSGPENVDDALDGAFSDDLDDFIDFETDRHLSMLTYGPSKRAKAARAPRANARLKVSSLRDEWKCIIKSQLI